MKFKVNINQFKQALEACSSSKGTDVKPSSEIEKCFYIETTEDNKLIVRGSNLAVDIRTVRQCQVIEAGRYIVKANILQWVLVFNEGMLHAEFSGGQLKCRLGMRRASFPSYDVGRYPYLKTPATELENYSTIDITATLEGVEFAMDKNDEDKALIYLSKRGCIATSGYINAFSTSFKFDGEFMLSSEAVKGLLGMIAITNQVQIGLVNNLLYVSFSSDVDGVSTFTEAWFSARVSNFSEQQVDRLLAIREVPRPLTICITDKSYLLNSLKFAKMLSDNAIDRTPVDLCVERGELNLVMDANSAGTMNDKINSDNVLVVGPDNELIDTELVSSLYPASLLTTITRGLGSQINLTYLKDIRMWFIYDPDMIDTEGNLMWGVVTGEVVAGQ